MGAAIRHYHRTDVKREIAEYLTGRWAAIEGEDRKWVRWEEEKPLTIKEPSDVEKLIASSMKRGLSVRSFYGSIEVFKSLEDRLDVEEKYDSNVENATPFIDIDVVDDVYVEKAWPFVVEIAKVITSWYCKEWGLCRSVYVLWTGAGAHVRINENAFSKSLLAEENPVNIAFAIAELTLRKLKREIARIIEASNGLVKVENIVAPKRVFTAPLSLHRRINYVAIAIKPEDLGLFTLSWSRLDTFKHDPQAWRRFEKGEADDLARTALREVGRRTTRTILQRMGRRTVEAREVVRSRVGRFPVMALLQAARYYLLTGDLERAKSFGLNRAIFYAWAKYYGPARSARRILVSSSRQRGPLGSSEDKLGGTDFVEVLGEKVRVSPRGFYVMGGIEQRPEDFDRNVARKFEEAGIRFEEAWKAALDYVSRFPANVLRDPQRFFKEVYEPVRDRFVEDVVGLEWEARPRITLPPPKRGEDSVRRKVKRPIGLDKWLQGVSE